MNNYIDYNNIAGNYNNDLGGGVYNKSRMARNNNSNNYGSNDNTNSNTNSNTNNNTNTNTNTNTNMNTNINTDTNNTTTNNMNYGYAYVPYQPFTIVFSPSEGLSNGTMFPELVNSYNPNQSLEIMNYLRYYNGGGCSV